ncbi:Mpo1-like protein [Arsukibacterium sp.]|uniref:Mpo1-like protein n=1 Tax=Arsukibacterium sp. TaxID=1977258 RepID=UPI002FD973EA
MTDSNTARFNSFKAFYPYYLQEHQNRTCRRLHVVGSTLVLLVLFSALLTGQWRLLWLVPLLGYGFAWVGHFFFEKNKPATFKYPLYSLLGDWVMYKDVLTGKIRF